ncbi:MAG: hypothetical protein M3Q07_00300, partial [Pseudobdellovibrionaceae bacterium]|nr:hypothetical protein [Pseudobdellovibrionaceae bacterium]
MFRHDVFIGSLLGTLVCTLGCQPHKKNMPPDLSSQFPDMKRALGHFSIQLEKSHEAHVLSQARMKLEQGPTHKHVTLQFKMIHIQEQVTLSFLHQSQPSPKIETSQDAEGDDRESKLGASRCMPSTALITDSVAPQLERRAPPLDHAALFRMPLPRSIQHASDVNVTGVGDAWNITQSSMLWQPNHEGSPSITLNWTRDHAPEVRYPLASELAPLHLQARRIDAAGEHSIPITWHDGFIWLEEQQEEGKAEAWLELQYDVPGTEPAFVLPQLPAFDTLKTLVMLPNCDRDQFVLEKNHLVWTCPQQEGPVWAASYSFHHTTGHMSRDDWPELAPHIPNAVIAFGDAGETLDVASYGSH